MHPIKEHRNRKGWSQRELARRAGLSRQAIERTETWRTSGEYALVRIADALGVSVDELREDVNLASAREAITQLAQKEITPQQYCDRVNRSLGLLKGQTGSFSVGHLKDKRTGEIISDEAGQPHWVIVQVA
jgi:transcriptional regulator with XRE-family HTH domain